MAKETTTIQITVDQYQRINSLKKPSEDLKDGLQKLIDERDELQERVDELEGQLNDWDRAARKQSGEDLPERTDVGTREREPDPTVEPDPSPPMDPDRPSDRLMDAERDAIENVVDDVASVWTEDGRTPARRRAAIEAAAYVVDEGGASKSELQEEVRPRFDVRRQTPRTWWEKNVRPVVAEIAAFDAGSKQWEPELEDVDAGVD